MLSSLSRSSVYILLFLLSCALWGCRIQNPSFAASLSGSSLCEIEREHQRWRILVASSLRIEGTSPWEFWLTEKEMLVWKTVQARAYADFLQHGTPKRGLKCEIDRTANSTNNVILDNLKFRMVVCESPCTAREAVSALNTEIEDKLPGTFSFVLYSKEDHILSPFRMAFPTFREVCALLTVRGADIRVEPFLASDDKHEGRGR